MKSGWPPTAAEGPGGAVDAAGDDAAGAREGVVAAAAVRSSDIMACLLFCVF